MRNFYDYLFLGIRENLASLYEDPKNIQEILRQHTAILAGIKSRDPQEAYTVMKKHISFVLNFFKDRDK